MNKSDIENTLSLYIENPDLKNDFKLCELALKAEETVGQGNKKIIQADEVWSDLSAKNIIKKFGDTLVHVLKK